MESKLKGLVTGWEIVDVQKKRNGELIFYLEKGMTPFTKDKRRLYVIGAEHKVAYVVTEPQDSGCQNSLTGEEILSMTEMTKMPSLENICKRGGGRRSSRKRSKQRKSRRRSKRSRRQK